MRFDNYQLDKLKNDIEKKRFKHIDILGAVATCTCVLMYVSYIPQIISNFSGHPVSPLQPLVAMINAILWVSYGWLKTYKDWAIIISNAPGVIFGLVTVITVYIH